MDQEQSSAPATGPDIEAVAGQPATYAATASPAVTMYTTSWCSDCVAAKRYLDAKGVSYVEVDIEYDEAAAQLVMELNQGRRSVPTLVTDSASASLSNFSIQKAQEFLRAAGLAR
ncbi:MAG: glutaredoxin domain-containing protein [Trueperaceae bacterium]